jgi:hypothetical protein
MKKLLLVLFGLSLISVVLIGFLYFRQKSVPQEPVVIAPPDIPNYTVQDKIKYQLNISQKDFVFPQEAPLLKMSSIIPYTDSEALTFANKLKFTSQPIIANDVFDGKTYIWNSDNATLTIWLKTRKLNYSLTTKPSTANTQFSDTTIKQSATNFLSDNFGLKSDDLKFSSFIYLKTTSAAEGFTKTNKDSASVYQVNFYPNVSQNTILTLDPNKTPYSVWVLPDGSIYEADINSVGGLSLGETKYPLKTFTDFTNAIQKAVIVNLDDGKVDTKDISQDSISTINVNKVSLAYLIDTATSDYLQPVFLIEGTAQIVGFSRNINIALYLQAIKTP